MSTIMRLRHAAQVNPSSPIFDRLPGDAEISFLRMESVWPGKWSDLKETRTKADVVAGFTRFQDGDVLVPKITPTFEASRSILVDGLTFGAGAGITELHVVRPTEIINPRFLLYLMHSHTFLRIGEAEMYGVAGQKRVPDDVIRDLEVWLPELDEQRRIADFLDAEVARIDSLLHTTEAQLSALRERFAELMRVMTTTGGSSDVVSTEVTWMPVMQEEWKLRKVGHYFQTGSGATPKADSENYFGGEYFWINTGDLKGSIIKQPKNTISSEALVAYSTLKIYDPGSLVVAMYGATTGKVGILGVPACVNQACCVLTELGGVDSQFAFYWFQAHRDEILGLASGGGQPNISQDLVRGLRIPAPDLASQVNIVSEIKTLENWAHSQEALLVKRKILFEERKRALITAAVTGQIDVTTARGADVS